LAIVVSFREDCSAKTTFAENHDGRPLSYEAGRFIHHALGHDQRSASLNTKPSSNLAAATSSSLIQWIASVNSWTFAAFAELARALRSAARLRR
jgi:hypothetical protein